MVAIVFKSNSQTFAGWTFLNFRISFFSLTCLSVQTDFLWEGGKAWVLFANFMLWDCRTDCFSLKKNNWKWQNQFHMQMEQLAHLRSNAGTFHHYNMTFYTNLKSTHQNLPLKFHPVTNSQTEMWDFTNSMQPSYGLKAEQAGTHLTRSLLALSPVIQSVPWRGLERLVLWRNAIKILLIWQHSRKPSDTNDFLRI